jgi:hypothetical protein
MKMTLIEMVQSILSAMDSDEVNSISDTVESLQVVAHLKETYYNLLSEREWPFLKKRIQLQHSGELSEPTTLLIPNGITKMYNFYYNKKEVKWVDPEVFMSMMMQRTENGLDIVEGGFYNSRDPLYYTSFDDKTIVCDGWNASESNTLMQSRTDCLVMHIPEWEDEDEFIPFLPARAFPGYLADAKSVCFLTMKQQANGKEEQKARQGRVMMQSELRRVNDATPKTNKLINYGR